MGKIGYIRVSTEHQETARQEALMKKYQVERVFAEKMSGKNADRPELKTMLEYVREGDTLYIESISRLGRSTRDLLNIIDVLQQKKVTLVSSKENIDTNTPQGRFVLSIFAALSELEREQTLQRQREGGDCYCQDAGEIQRTTTFAYRLGKVRAAVSAVEVWRYYGGMVSERDGSACQHLLSQAQRIRKKVYINETEPGNRLQSSFNRVSFLFAIFQKTHNDLCETLF